MKFSGILTLDKTQTKKPFVALFGGGGKTSLLYQLGNEFTKQYNRVLLTSIVKAGPSPNFSIVLSKPDKPITDLITNHHPLYLLKEKIRKDKYCGFESSELECWLPNVDACVFEADGAKDLPLKAHSDYDPIIPSFTSHVIIVIGADVIETTLNEGKIHRPDIFKSLWGIKDDTVIDIPLITKVVTDKKGYLSKIPNGIKIVYFVNKANTFQEQAQDLALSIKLESSASVYYGSVREKWWKRVN